MDILTNSAALTAILALNRTQRALTATEDEASTGLAVSSASDNAAYWSMAVGQNAQIGALQTVLNSLSMSEGIVSVTNTALTDVIGDVENISRDLVSANQTGANLAALQEDISANQQAIIAAGNSATFNGVNWLVHGWEETVSTTIQNTFDISQSQMDQALAQSNGTFEDAVTQTLSVNYTDTQDNETVTGTSTASETVDYSLSNSGASIDPSIGGQDDYENYSVASPSQSSTKR